MPLIRSILALEAAAFGAAALVHSGTLIQGYEHSKAATAESVIGVVLLIGLIASVTIPRASRTVTKLDIAFHVVLVAALLSGLVVVARQTTDTRSRA